MLWCAKACCKNVLHTFVHSCRLASLSCNWSREWWGGGGRSTIIININIIIIGGGLPHHLMLIKINASCVSCNSCHLTFCGVLIWRMLQVPNSNCDASSNVDWEQFRTVFLCAHSECRFVYILSRFWHYKQTTNRTSLWREARDHEIYIIICTNIEYYMDRYQGKLWRYI